MRQEFRLLAGIVRDYMPSEYPYEVEGDSDRAKDYSDTVDVLPVSDPNSTTMAQRIMQYQAALQLAQGQPGIYDMPALHRKMIYTLGIKDPDTIIPVTDNMKPTDPVTENMAILNGKPVKAFLSQDHESHIAVHTSAMQDPMIQKLVGQSPNAGPIQAASYAHIQEHIAFAYRQRIEQQLGAPLPAPKDVLPEDVEVRLAPLLAQAAQKVLQNSQQQAQQEQAQQQAQDPVIQMQQQDLQIRQQEVQRKAAKDQMDAQLARDVMAQQAQIAQQKMAVEQSIAGARIGMDSAKHRAAEQTKNAQISSTERTQGARIGVDIAKDRFGG
jgi:hypothetical protein